VQWTIAVTRLNSVTGGKYIEQGTLAPGESIQVAEPGGGVGGETGTSYATAVASGVAALLLSVQLKKGHPPDPSGVREAIFAERYRLR